MDLSLIDLVLHLDKTLLTFFETYGWVAYALVFLIIFTETGVVVMPFLPGDSLLFACGALCSSLGLDYWVFFGLIAVAAILGNTSNYAIGRFAGKALLATRPGKKPLIAPEHLEKTHQFFEKWGGWAVSLSRFLPFLRTFLPFVAGVGRMGWNAFSFYNALGGLAWTALFLTAGYFFGNLPFVKDNFSLIVMGIVIVPGLPALVTFFWPKKKAEEPRP